MRNQERGASPWPFIITLVLFLVAVFLWYSEKGESDKQRDDAAKANKELKLANDAYTAVVQRLDEVTKVVGFKETFKLPNETTIETPSPTRIAKALAVEDKDSAVAKLKEAATVTMKSDTWKPSANVATKAAVEIDRLPPELKENLKAVKDAYPGAAPPAPLDMDDAGKVATYAAELKAYEVRFAAYKDAMKRLMDTPAAKAYGVSSGWMAEWVLDKNLASQWMFTTGTGTPATLEELAEYPVQLVKNVTHELVVTNESHQATIQALEKKADALALLVNSEDEATLGFTGKFKATEAKHAEDLRRMTAELEKTKGDLEAARAALVVAQNAQQKTKQDAEAEASQAKQKMTVLENAIMVRDEIRALTIARDDPKGEVLAADSALGTGYVNLGNADRVYPGLRFKTFHIGKGGFRVYNGVVEVAKVLDAHYSQVRLVSQTPGEKVVARGDQLSNPLYSKTDAIRIYVPGTLRKYPREVAVARLARMGVIVENKIHQGTDYLLVPDTVTVTPEAPAEGEGDGAAPVQSELDKYVNLARQFGAALITERMIAVFLDY